MKYLVNVSNNNNYLRITYIQKGFVNSWANSNFSAWIMAIISVTIISLCGLIGVGIVPLTRFAFYHEILRFMIAIAVGTLCGDALMVSK